MKYPCLVPERVCKTEITVRLTDGLDEDGVPKVVLEKTVCCNYSEKQKQILDAERRLTLLEAVALFPGNLAPEKEHMAGNVTVKGIERSIYRASRVRNPDGTVNYTSLELM